MVHDVVLRMRGPQGTTKGLVDTLQPIVSINTERSIHVKVGAVHQYKSLRELLGLLRQRGIGSGVIALDAAFLRIAHSIPGIEGASIECRGSAIHLHLALKSVRGDLFPVQLYGGGLLRENNLRRLTYVARLITKSVGSDINLCRILR